uniref:Uncharacterized protein n=1 Tax=Alexandrium catenella TaxID=2925 RepID=A0A7S1WEB8_ALECA|mmetsp:Transcript_53925/g.144437  ORF Transcript_53925/g.144437 Transcript_53925/m.144437 type:complete len:102 (+) Transcript_53925:70-375(+)
MPSTMADCVLRTDELMPGLTFQDRCLRKITTPEVKGIVCMANCVSTVTQLSLPCSVCFGELAQCTYENCATRCLDAKSDSCVSCTGQFCIPTFDKCAGLPK